MPEGAADPAFCCTGCKAVFGLLREQGLERYYDLAGESVVPVADSSGERSDAWLEPILARSLEGEGAVCTLDLDVQGLHCAACVWLMDELFRRREGGSALTVNPALGKLRVSWQRGRFDPRAFLADVERFGYRFGPSRKRTVDGSRGLLLRLGITAALAMNVMLFSVAFYVGLAPQEERIYRLFTELSVWLSAAVVCIGGWPFFKSAWLSLRRGVLHLDLPIALGILLVFGTSLHQARGGRGLFYFDTLNTFTTLMLVGRWLQQRILDRNRRFLLEDGGADGILVRRREGDRLVAVRAPLVRAGDHLVAAPGDLVPVDAQALEAGSFSTDWITGEAEVREIPAGQRVPAGAFNAGRRAIALVADTDFEESPLPALLRTTAPRSSSTHARFWDRLSRIYVVAVLAIAALGLGVWWPMDPERALEVTAALLVVTCPCAIGIAIPLAYELAQSRLRKAGFFVRRQDLLDELPRVRKLLFDKTGTLTLGRLRLRETEGLTALAPELRDAAFDMASRSNHPVSRCLSEELARMGARFDADASVEELPGLGLQLVRGGHTFRLGRPAWAGADAADPASTVLSMDGAAVAAFRTEETLRVDARRELDALREQGLEVWLLSGDAPAKVAAVATRLGIDEELAKGALSPEAKAALVDELDEGDTLFLGDGVNDSLAFERATCAGTPAIDRPVVPGKADFFLLGEGIRPIREAISLSLRLRQVNRRLIAVAVAYNLLAVVVSLAGWMTPLRAAIVMPLSSIGILLFTLASLEGREPKMETNRMTEAWR
ncbi:Type cbb3 cytochrome oxidase biogenesis protein CcoI [Vulgatibacter incomptus]|uniref:Type cbb3 cytochrome oxidase biogenesis protein CcoI n=1 Tax=Vulgatibacter incomptus TaxID=1391653 RepID=A0A0K1PHJ4_9BACT|nr:Type cbb3 cytochrome oxidase biogenesis protein CcoI [Vulgatibacter incomptus]